MQAREFVFEQLAMASNLATEGHVQYEASFGCGELKRFRLEPIECGRAVRAFAQRVVNYGAIERAQQGGDRATPGRVVWHVLDTRSIENRFDRGVSASVAEAMTRALLGT